MIKLLESLYSSWLDWLMLDTIPGSLFVALALVRLMRTTYQAANRVALKA